MSCGPIVLPRPMGRPREADPREAADRPRVLGPRRPRASSLARVSCVAELDDVLHGDAGLCALSRSRSPLPMMLKPGIVAHATPAKHAVSPRPGTVFFCVFNVWPSTAQGGLLCKARWTVLYWKISAASLRIDQRAGLGCRRP